MPGLLEPTMLCAALVALLLWPFLWKSENTRAAILKSFQLPPPAVKKRIFWSLLPLLLLSLALAKPYFGSEPQTITTEGLSIYLIVDTSSSMLAQDLKPTRLELGKRKMRQLLEKLPFTSQLSLIAFAGGSAVICPPTLDRAIFIRYLDSLGPTAVSFPGSYLRGAFNLVRENINARSEKKPLVLLLSDGETPGTEAANLAQELRTEGIKIFALGLGTLEGAPIPRGGDLIRDHNGKPVISKLNAGVLKVLAEGTGGEYQQAGYSDDDINRLSQTIGKQEGSGKGTNSVSVLYHEKTSLIALLVLVLVLFRLKREGVLICVSLICAAFSFFAANSSALASPLNAYESGDFESAYREYSELHKKYPEERGYLDGLAKSAYKLKRYQEAAELFKLLENKSQNPEQRLDSIYNRGNSELLQGQYKSAIESYEESLKTYPNDSAARFNLEIAKKLLEEEQKKKQSSSSSDSSSSQSSSSSSSSASSSSSSSDSSSSDNNSESSSSQGSPASDDQDSSKSSSNSSSSNSSLSSSSSANSSDKNSSQAAGQNQSSASSLADDFEQAKRLLDKIPDTPLLMFPATSPPPNSDLDPW